MEFRDPPEPMEGVAQDDSDSFMEGKKNCDYKQKHREDRSISRLNQYKPVLTHGKQGVVEDGGQGVGKDRKQGVGEDRKQGVGEDRRQGVGEDGGQGVGEDGDMEWERTRE